MKTKQIRRCQCLKGRKDEQAEPGGLTMVTLNIVVVGTCYCNWSKPTGCSTPDYKCGPSTAADLELQEW